MHKTVISDGALIWYLFRSNISDFSNLTPIEQGPDPNVFNFERNHQEDGKMLAPRTTKKVYGRNYPNEPAQYCMRNIM